MTAPMGFARLVLEPAVGRGDVIAAADAAGWTLRRRVERDDPQPFELVWFPHDPGASVHYVEDHLIDVAHLLVRGDDRAAAVEEARAVMPAVPVDRLLAEASAAATARERLPAIRRLAVAADEAYHEPTFRVFLDYFADPDPEVRGAAVFATAYAGWTAFEEPLQRLAAEDQHAGVRDLAARMLASLARHSWTKGAHRQALGADPPEGPP